MERFRRFFEQVFVQLAVFLFVEFFVLKGFKMPEELSWITTDTLGRICIGALLFALFLGLQLSIYYRKFKNTPSLKDYDFVESRGVYRHRTGGYNCCPRCLISDKLEARMSIEFDCLVCSVCGKKC